MQEKGAGGGSFSGQETRCLDDEQSISASVRRRGKGGRRKQYRTNRVYIGAQSFRNGMGDTANGDLFCKRKKKPEEVSVGGRHGSAGLLMRVLLTDKPPPLPAPKDHAVLPGTSSKNWEGEKGGGALGIFFRETRNSSGHSIDYPSDIQNGRA